MAEPHVDVPNEARVTFRVVSDDLDPKQITERMGLTADEQHRKGDLRRKGRNRDWYYPRGGWHLESQLPPTARVEDHLSHLLDRLEGTVDVIAKLIAEGYQVDFYIGYFSNQGQGGPLFSAELLRRLANFGAEVGLDIYHG